MYVGWRGMKGRMYAGWRGMKGRMYVGWRAMKGRMYVGGGTGCVALLILNLLCKYEIDNGETLAGVEPKIAEAVFIEGPCTLQRTLL